MVGRTSVWSEKTLSSRPCLFTPGPAIAIQVRVMSSCTSPWFQAKVEFVGDTPARTRGPRGPQIREHTTIRRMHNTDVAPTIMRILGVAPLQVDSEVLH